jgi:hypothetical protein
MPSMSGDDDGKDAPPEEDTLVVPPRGRCLTANGEPVANRGYDNARVRQRLEGEKKKRKKKIIFFLFRFSST